jgi:hypothetical protein
MVKEKIQFLFVKTLFLQGIFLCIFLQIPVHAKTTVPVPDSLVCMDAARKIEKHYKIHPYILSAVALTETGKQLKIGKKNIQTPWPWTANIEGKGYYFKSKAEAIEKISIALRSGKRSIDVGCMQINLKYHRDAFANLSEAFDPYANVQYGAEFLKSLYGQYKSWPRSVERYHSATPIHYNRYRKIVAANWHKAEELMRPNHGVIFSYFQIHDQENAQLKSQQKSITDIQEQSISFRQKRMQDIAQMRAAIRTKSE